MAQQPQRDQPSLAIRFELEGDDAVAFADMAARSERTPTQQTRFLIRQSIGRHRDQAATA